ncbi:uncharacterized protein TNIN_60021 [Trichonephila inaurata madagascariensis]|uniref:RNA-directed DNA polymerase from mobile element jockey n=1 Tax=Trichonephila inaurata madagascariensis TaxID=2747483 RepID=A0A8X6Y705_9ARAC|nr:uncharacterized protein TNIN_60021 [Trichonephila inaurata madagascariensis]
MNFWKTFLADITGHNVWKEIYTHGVKTNFTKRLEISEIEVSSGHFTSFEYTVDAVLRKSFPRDPNSQDNSQHRVLRSEAELVYERDDDVPFTRTEIACVIENNLSLNKSPGSDRINNELIKKFHICSPSVLLTLFNNCLKLGVFPKIWKKAKIVLLPKSTELSRTHIDNIRCISLLPSSGKCLEKLCITRLNHY